MKRRLPRDVKFAQDGSNGRSVREIIHQWVSKAKRRTHKRERREGLMEAIRQRDDT